MQWTKATVMLVAVSTSMAFFGPNALMACCPGSPEEVIHGTIMELLDLAKDYPELADFPTYIKELGKQSSGDGDKQATLLKVAFVRNMDEIDTKRGIRPSDFGENGIYVVFALVDGSEPEQLEGHTLTDLPNLHLKLHAHICLSENPSPGLEGKLAHIVDDLKSMLGALDRRAARKTASQGAE